MKNTIIKNILVVGLAAVLVLPATVSVTQAAVMPVSGFSGSFSDGTITLSWNTPSDGMLNQLEIHYSMSLLTEGNFYISSQLLNVPQPIPGTSQSMQIPGFASGQTYYFGIITTNIMAERSPIVMTSVDASSGGNGGGGGGDNGDGGNTGGGNAGGGGGAASPILPIADAKIVINNNADRTDTIDVTLALTATGAARMKISNDAALSGASWEAYTDTKQWTLTEEKGKKTVYARYINSNHEESETVSDDIQYGEEKPAPVAVTPTSTVETKIVYVPVPTSPTVISKTENILDFNTIMVNWGVNKAGNYADLNKDSIVDSGDVRVLMDGWVPITVHDVYIPSQSAASLAVSPGKFNLVNGDEISVIVDVSPIADKTSYTASIKIRYPKDILEYKSMTYWSDWIPVVREGYDVVDQKNGVVVKTAGMPGGFDKQRVFGVMKFIVKKSGGGTIAFAKDSFLLDSGNFDNLSGTHLWNTADVNSISKTSKILYQLANIISLGKFQNVYSFIAVFIFFGLVYGVQKTYAVRKAKIA
ncbi:MAG: hypothetical protein UX22_C0003G0015 [Candidatus Jorgensenbacteria bacterium GW2011_GWA2_45_9]|uniref:Cohesin domain-containing protein n=1 Tax=Candidatus Jorgensenbacteria bacterium GW2011_GWA2_45_9 TaxID=1618663 RepID=A0A0G1R4J7_9BACT|nr:MAG: hypothetical protein UX22_C0003G0015 [Candidatus Jorgensenbacteria bacterium GW2011_GWA2_45_9]